MRARRIKRRSYLHGRSHDATLDLGAVSARFVARARMRPGPRSGARVGVLLAAGVLACAACTQETQNEIGRAVQNWTGTDGVLEVYGGDKVVKRFLEIDKLTTATATHSSESRAYRYGYGVLDENLNGVVDAGEAKVYFEISDYSTPYVFYENPRSR